MAEGVLQYAYKLSLSVSKLQRICGVNGGEVAVKQVVGRFTDPDGARYKVHRLEHSAVSHIIFGMTGDYLSLKLKLDHSDSLVHLSGEGVIDYVVLDVVERLHDVVPIHLTETGDGVAVALIIVVVEMDGLESVVAEDADGVNNTVYTGSEACVKYEIKEMKVTSKTKLKVRMAPSGGFAISIK